MIYLKTVQILKGKTYKINPNSQKRTKVFDISDFENDSKKMLEAFWLSLLREVKKGSVVYFHNWAGYDAILSMTSLANLHRLGYTFKPILNKGKIISLTVLLKNKVILTIKDSILVIPGALGKLAKDFKVETQKDHFPHYFNPLELNNSLTYEGALPEYNYFEPKRTTHQEYDEMVQIFKDKPWNFLEVSRSYIQGDVIAQHQVLISFFETLRDQFPINPLENFSAPGIAFTTWKTVQLPKLGIFKVYDLSQSSDALFREGYLGGIVDVFRPHLSGKARVQAPENQNIGLLPEHLNGRLVCPAGTFEEIMKREQIMTINPTKFTVYKGGFGVMKVNVSG
jgi:hypothetical protein